MQFTELKLGKPIQEAIKRQGYTKPTPIQAQAIPPQLKGKDILGIAQTGTGKTAAFCLPLIHKLSTEKKQVKPRHCRALILAPTRELAAQIAKSVEEYGRNTKIRYAIIFGGVGQNPQVQAMLPGVDILIATPGRLLDLKNQGHVKLEGTEVFILDEADRMLDMGFLPDIKKVLKDLPEKRQTVFFSATIPPAIHRLADSILTDPVRVEIQARTVTADTVSQKLIAVSHRRKNKLLLHLLESEHLESVLVFTRTKYKADKVAREIKKAGIKADSIHGDKSQNKRTRALQAFHLGKVRVLVATDIAARGIDVEDITHVINYDLPDDADNYVHRIGRTGRAKQEGIAYSFYAPDEKKKLGAIERNIGFRIDVLEVPDFSVDLDRPPASGKRGYAKKKNKGKKKERTSGSIKPKLVGRRDLAPGQSSEVKKVGKRATPRGKPRKKKTDAQEAYNNKKRKHRKKPRRRGPQQRQQKRRKQF